MDRLWVHPTEAFAVARPRPAPAASRARTIAWMTGAGVVGAIAAIVALSAAGLLDASPRLSNPSSKSAAVGPLAGRIAARVAPGVVGVEATGASGARRGSGICLATGQVVTTALLLEGAASVRVQEPDGTTHDATVMGTDSWSGLGVVRVTGARLAPIKAAPDKKLGAGDWVMAATSGPGTGPWVSSGIVSSMAATASGATPDGMQAGMITATTPLPQTATGGALVDQDGDVVGIIAGASPTDAALALATPVAVAQDVMRQLADGGPVRHGLLGIEATDSTNPRGARVASVTVDSPAAASGIQAADVIVGVDSHSVTDVATLVYEIRSRAPGDTVTLHVRRRNALHTMSAMLSATPDSVTTSP